MGSETIFHIDVNSAYLSWSAIRRLQNGDPLDLRTIPSIIGGDQERRHGIVLAKSIPAKKYGIQTADRQCLPQMSHSRHGKSGYALLSSEK